VGEQQQDADHLEDLLDAQVVAQPGDQFAPLLVLEQQLGELVALDGLGDFDQAEDADETQHVQGFEAEVGVADELGQHVLRERGHHVQEQPARDLVQHNVPAPRDEPVAFVLEGQVERDEDVHVEGHVDEHVDPLVVA